MRYTSVCKQFLSNKGCSNREGNFGELFVVQSLNNKYLISIGLFICILFLHVYYIMHLINKIRLNYLWLPNYLIFYLKSEISRYSSSFLLFLLIHNFI